MTIEVLKSKIHRVTVTGAELDYVGSITIDPVLMDAANLVAERILITRESSVWAQSLAELRATKRCASNVRFGSLAASQLRLNPSS